MSKEKFITIVEDKVDYRTIKKSNGPDTTEFKMKTSKNGEWSDRMKNKTMIKALDDGNDVYLWIRNSETDEMPKKPLCFNYADLFTLYCFLDLVHQNDPYYMEIKTINISKTLNELENYVYGDTK